MPRLPLPSLRASLSVSALAAALCVGGCPTTDDITAAATYTVTVMPSLALTDVATTLFVYDEAGREIHRMFFRGNSWKTYDFSMPIGTYRFVATSVGQLTATTLLAAHTWSFHGYLDLSASVNERASGEIEVSLSCDPGARPGWGCFNEAERLRGDWIVQIRNGRSQEGEAILFADTEVHITPTGEVAWIADVERPQFTFYADGASHLYPVPGCHATYVLRGYLEMDGVTVYLSLVGEITLTTGSSGPLEYHFDGATQSDGSVTGLVTGVLYECGEATRYTADFTMAKR